MELINKFMESISRSPLIILIILLSLFIEIARILHPGGLFAFVIGDRPEDEH